jgi:hypothetical protein
MKSQANQNSLHQASSPTTTHSCHHLNSKKVPRRQRNIEIEQDYAIVHRARECLDCGKTFFTLEDIEYGEEVSDRVHRRVVSEFYLDLLHRGALGNVIPWGWPFAYRTSSLVRHLQSQLPEGTSIRYLLSNKNHRIRHITPVSEFGYPLPHEDIFQTAWCLKNLTIQPYPAIQMPSGI